MAVIGQVLTSPESGWKRYDNAHGAFVKVGTNWKENATGTGSWGSPQQYTSDVDAKLSFDFIGSKIRIMQRTNTDNRTATIKIDNVSEEYVRKVAGHGILVYEKEGLSLQRHKVEITWLNDNTSSNIPDSIDIDSNGRLLHPDEVLTPAELEVGKRIRCHYQASSNTVGTFSNLGQETYVDGINDFIPPASSATPNGNFYYIAVDKDHLGRWKLIADRNIQHSISWDTLNTSGIASGSGLPMEISGVNGKFTTRLLTGGISSSDKDNEWDKYIVGSDLGGSIIAGDNNVWNWNSQYSWTSSTPSSSSTARARRGGATSISQFGNNGTSTVVPQFRPVLLIKMVTINKSFILLNGEYKKFSNDWQTISKTLPSLDTFKDEGMDDLSAFDRKETKFVIPMDNNSLQGEVLGEGRMFRETIDLKKYFDIVGIDVIGK